MLLDIIIILVLLSIVWQDFKSYVLYWFIPPVLIVLFFLRSWQMTGLNLEIQYIGINLLFVVLQVSIVYMYYVLKNRKLIPMIDKYIGWGDILFLVCLSFAFSPLNFIFFYIISLIIILIIYGSWYMFNGSLRKIPLAGMQALLLLISIISGNLLHFSFYNDKALSYFISHL